VYASLNIIRVNISRRIRWAGNVPRMVYVRNAYKILAGNLQGKRPLG
jgi:hypothetical protein